MVPYEFIGFEAMDVTKPYEFIGFEAMDVTKPYKFIGFEALERWDGNASVEKPQPILRHRGPHPPHPTDLSFFVVVLKQKIKNKSPLHASPQRDPVVVYWPSGFLEAWGTNANKPHFFRTLLVLWPCRRRRRGQQTSVFMNKCGFLALVPQASQKPLGQ